jgi:predicted DNA-binding protein (MmcQ/YjbR family)
VTSDELLAYCLAKPGAWKDEPWEGDVVAKVGSKIFAFFGAPPVSSVSLKCGPSRDVANEWLRRFPDDASVMAYIGRSGWNTLRIDGAIPDDELLEAIDASYETVVAKLPKRTGRQDDLRAVHRLAALIRLSTRKQPALVSRKQLKPGQVRGPPSRHPRPGPASFK